MPCNPLYLHPQGSLTKHYCGSASASSLKAAGHTNQAPGLQAHRLQVARWFCNCNVLAGPAMESSDHLKKPPTQGQCLHGVDTLPLQQRVHGQNHHQRKNGHAVNLNRQTAHNSFRQGNTGGPAELPNVPQCPTQARNTAYIPYTGQALGSALHCHVKYLPHSTSNATTKPTSTHTKPCKMAEQKSPPITHSTVAPPSLTVQSQGTQCQTRLSCTTVVELCPV